MKSKAYKYCAVPLCDNTTTKTPQKLFIHVPTQKERRKHWFRLARRTKPLTARSIYYCEDHFDLPSDMDNFMEYHIKGSVSQIRMKPDCEPTKFDCQPNRKRGPSILKGKSRPSTNKRQKESLNEYCLKDKEQNQSFVIQRYDEDNEVPPECSEEYGALEPQNIGFFKIVKVESTYEIDTSEIKDKTPNTISDPIEECEALEPQHLRGESPLSASTLSAVSTEDYDSNDYTELSEHPFNTNNLRQEEKNNCIPKSNSPICINKLHTSNALSGPTKSIHDLNIQIKEEELKIKKEEVKQSKIKTRLLLLDLKLKRRMLVRDQVH